jgi:hypothetical protein
VLQVFRDHEARALFVTEIIDAVGLPGVDVERACADLIEQRSLLVVENAFPDPHLAGVNLRIAALLSSSCADAEDRAHALRSATACWEKWLLEFLGSHRCQ